MTTPALESALAKLREPSPQDAIVILSQAEATALLAKIEAADRLAQRVDEYLNGKWLGRGLMAALADYTGKPWAPPRNPQPAGGGG